MHKSGEFVSKALCAGVRGYVLKDNALEELIECIQLVYERKIYLSQDITGIVVDGFRPTVWDYIGSAVALLGAAIIILAPQAATAE